MARSSGWAHRDWSEARSAEDEEVEGGELFFEGRGEGERGRERVFEF
jgi:hypothetical protein